MVLPTPSIRQPEIRPPKKLPAIAGSIGVTGPVVPTLCNGDCPVHRSKHRRIVLPSMATISSLKASARKVVDQQVHGHGIRRNRTKSERTAYLGLSAPRSLHLNLMRYPCLTQELLHLHIVQHPLPVDGIRLEALVASLTNVRARVKVFHANLY